IPNEMFAAIFVMGRVPGWLSQWIEQKENAPVKITRPRQLYIGAADQIK
ncbi:MAG: citrate/2-methylcitrate synthase, partial [Campylobacter sp.]|nr:citrate/2-methylcitrate synthase [Campylobacter sp.]